MRALFSVLPIAFLGLLLSACAPTVSGNVDSFAVEELDPTAETVIVKAYPDDLAKSLQYQEYKKLLEEKLKFEGFTLTEEETAASLVAFFNFGIDNGVEVKDDSDVGNTSITVGGGSGRGGTFMGIKYRIPIYTGRDLGYPPSTYYTRHIQVNMIRAETIGDESPERVYEGYLESKGTCGVLSTVMPEMLTLLFDKFPDGSGKSSTERVGEC